MQLSLRPIALPLRHVFRTAHGAAAVQENLLVELRDEETGLCGYVALAGASGWYGSDPLAIRRAGTAMPKTVRYPLPGDAVQSIL